MHRPLFNLAALAADLEAVELRMENHHRTNQVGVVRDAR
jgi:hypothetical protein